MFVRKNGAALPAAAVSPVAIDLERSKWYKVTAGAYTRRYQADSLLLALRKSGVLTDSAGSVTTAPLALVVDSEEKVQALHRKALQLGGKDEGAPGRRSESFYAGYFRDLDGNKLNVFVGG